ncbi:PREDICTED: ethanolamine-phosphate cytidylyltransferase-like isoform X2 [Tarenaya hassleriana]|uniref:ethanolamine-phosphate cytidylyltransferase-like isoform X2 n=1 Tax=Tarenaya hassleriana TaxID=28532 RepID=UPI00053C6E42|nr:PREDICTED: ethanolamine-phosphate cytidylyltransferase-like isoform X2 [Tarenaya hassleriana]
MVSEQEKIVGSCLFGAATAVIGASLLHLYWKGEPLPLGLGLGLGLPWRRFRQQRKPVRVYMDGCFDMMHYGHCNALRQARALGDQLVVGVVSDEEIIANKGPPVTPLHERMIMVKAVKWVDEVIPDAPYAITEDFMKRLFVEYQIDYIIHGDDPCVLPDGTDAYALAKKAGRYKQIKRTEGVSSTDIVGRMLLCVRERSINDSHNHSSLQRQFSHGHSPKFEDGGYAAATRVTHFLPTSRRIVQFSNGKGPGPDQRIIYIDGAFDLFHAGHVEILRVARELGDFLLVGIHNDQTISAKRGAHRPIMNLHERSLSVLACRYVDEVIIGAPWEVSKDMSHEGTVPEWDAARFRISSRQGRGATRKEVRNSQKRGKVATLSTKGQGHKKGKKDASEKGEG